MFSKFSLKNISISVFFKYMNVLFVALLVVLIIITLLIDFNRKEYGKEYERQQAALSLSRELRQTSDDLHRMALIITLNQENIFKEYYREIAGILYGENMKPQDYNRVYWDYLLANGVRPRPSIGEAVAFPALLQKTDLTQAEIKLILSAYESIQDQINLEIQAIQYAIDQSPKPLIIQFQDLLPRDSVVLNFKNDSINITKHKQIVDSLIRASNTFRNSYQANIGETKAKNLATAQYFMVKLKVTENLDKYEKLVNYNFNLHLGNIQYYREVLNSMYILLVVLSILTSFIALLMVDRILGKPLNTLLSNLQLLSTGELPESRIEIQSKNELGRISQYYNHFVAHLEEVVDFANLVGKGNYESAFTPLGNKDALGNALINMRDSLQKAASEEDERKKLDMNRNWTTAGLANFGDILREQYKNEDDHYFRIMSELVRYTSSVLGGLFLLSNNSEDTNYVELVTSYAYDARRYRKKKIRKGDGIIGTTMIEQNVVHLTNVPIEYSEISSGLGHTPPNSILIVPISNEKIFVGIIELGSLEPYPPHVIEFVKHLSDDLASTFASIRANKQTQLLLQQSRVQSDELASQEEEMRQNLEELQATQEEMARREAENARFLHALDMAVLKAECDIEGRILSANQKFAQTMGFSILEIDGKPIRNLIHRADSDNFNTRWGEMIAQNLMFEISSTFKTNTDWLWLKAKFIPVVNENGKIEKVLFIAMDFDSMFTEKVNPLRKSDRY